MEPTPVFLPGESHGQRRLAGHSPQGCKESNVTEQLSVPMHTCTHTYTHTNHTPWLSRVYSRVERLIQYSCIYTEYYSITKKE